MITQAIVQIVGFLVNKPCKYFLASAFSWNEIALQCAETKGSRRRWKCGSLVMTFYFLFLLYGLVRHIREFKRENMFDTAYHTLYVIGYFTTMCDKANYFRCRDFYVPVVNGLFKYYLHHSELSGMFLKEKFGRQIFLMEFCVKMLVHNIFTIPIFSLVQYIRNPGNSVHLSCLFINYPVCFYVLYFPAGVLQVALMGSMITELTINTILTVLTPYCYIITFSTLRFSSIQVINTYLQKESKGQATIVPFLRTAQVIRVLYGQLLQGRILPLHFVLSYLSAISLFTLIRFRYQLPWELVLILLSTSISASTGWLTILWFLGDYYRTGYKFLVSWKLAKWPRSSLQRKFLKKFYRSCKPVEFTSHPHIFLFRPVTMLKYMDFINWLLAKSLIGIK